jgi:hypothetical protein
MRIGSIPILVAMMTACGGEPAQCDAAACADICAATPVPEPAGAAGLELTAYEQDLLDPVVKDVRLGVRPFNEEGIGICKGTSQCDEYLGREVKDLPPGKYMIRAELEVPDVGDKGTWKVDFSTECVTIKETANGETRSNNEYNRSYDVVHNRAERGYRLQPLRTIESPSKYGKRECKWKLVAPHPDGDKVYEGFWSVPAA